MAVLFTSKTLDYCRSKRSRGVVGARAVALSIHVHSLFIYFHAPIIKRFGTSGIGTRYRRCIDR